MKHFTAIIAFLLISTVCNAKPLPFRVWEFQDYNMPHIKRLIDMASKQKVNRIHLSHEIVMYAQQPVENPQLAKDVNTICDWAHAKGIKVDVWCRDISGVPDEFVKDNKIDLTNPKAWEAVQSKYVKLLQVCPNVDGIVLSLMEGAVCIYGNKVISPLSGAERVAMLIDKVDEVCKKYNKTLYVRTFAYTPQDLKAIQEGVKMAKADVIAMPKCVPHDWQPFYPFSPDIGDAGGKRQVVEFDLGHEFTGLSTIPYVNIEYMKRHLDYGIGRNISGAVFRVERVKWWAVDTPNQAVIDVATRLLLTPSADPHKLYKDWLSDRYPREAVPHLYSAFMRTQDVVEKGLFVLGNWVSDHSKVPSYRYAKSHLQENSVSNWDSSPHWKQVTEELLNPTPGTIKKVELEKAGALKMIDASIADVKKAKPYLKPSDYNQLMDLFQREKAMVVVWQSAMKVILGMDVYNTTKSSSDRKFLASAADELEKVTLENRQHLINMLVDYDNPQPMSNVNTAKGLVKEARRIVLKPQNID